MRPAVADSLSIAASSGKVRSGTHSSNPSRHTNESSLMRPLAAFRRRSLRRTGPTGTPLMPTYHSSVLELDDNTAIAADTEDGSSFGPETALEKAPASPAPPEAGGAFGADRPAGGRDDEGAPGTGVRGRAPERLGLMGRGGGGAGRGRPAAAACTAPFAPETPVEVPGRRSSSGLVAATEVSVTDASTSIMWLHLRHFIRTVRPATLSSAI